MKLRNNMLQQENDELRSQLDTANKLLSRDTRLLVKKYQELKDKKHDSTTVEFDWVCIMLLHLLNS